MKTIIVLKPDLVISLFLSAIFVNHFMKYQIAPIMYSKWTCAKADSSTVLKSNIKAKLTYNTVDIKD